MWFRLEVPAWKKQRDAWRVNQPLIKRGLERRNLESPGLTRVGNAEGDYVRTKKEDSPRGASSAPGPESDGSRRGPVNHETGCPGRFRLHLRVNISEGRHRSGSRGHYRQFESRRGYRAGEFFGPGRAIAPAIEIAGFRVEAL